MTKREKIILAVTAITIVAGTLYYVLDQGSGGAPGKGGADLKSVQDFAGQTAEQLSKASPTQTQEYILARASTEWASDPFLGRKLVEAKTEEAKVEKESAILAYTGFIITGQAKLAVINGMEYQVGEAVQGCGCIVQSIDPQQVIMKQAGGQASFTVPFTGEVLREVR